MFKRLLTLVSLAGTGILSLAFLAAPAVAQDQGYFTYVSFWAVPRNDWAAFEKQEKSSDATMQRLVAEGTLVAWGDEAARVHQEDGYTHAEWFTATNRANLLKALEVEWASATNAAYVATTKHSDLLLHTLYHGGKTASGATGYIRVTYWHAKPGAEGALEGYVAKSIKPVLDDAAAKGTILMYNFDKQDIHTEPPGSYNLAIIFPDAEAMDKFFTDLAAAGKQDPTVGEVLESLTVSKDHRDNLGRVTAYEHK